SVENNFSLKKLVGSKNFSTGMLDKEQSCVQLILNILKNNNIYIPSLKEIESYDVILIIGEDLTQTSARISLAVRQAVKNKSQDLAKLNNIPLWHSSAILNLSHN
ncbi:MAG: NADH-quinone oxidoreductase subunit G, partial [Buchnera aphidicola]|nr:NADH-quinone oxidoreductase subunit G [Buchnera aphidicola]